MTHFDAASAAVEAALAAGARYADARAMHRRYESMTARNGAVTALLENEDAGIGVRALVGSSWGYYAVPDLGTAAARRAGGRAAEIAAASASVPGPAIDLVHVDPQVGTWASRCEEDPLAVPLSEKGDLLTGVTATAHRAGADVAQALYQIWTTTTWLVSSAGHRIEQQIRKCGAGMSATAIGDDETQRRSYPSMRGHYGTRGLGTGPRDSTCRPTPSGSPRRRGPCSRRRCAPPARPR